MYNSNKKEFLFMLYKQQTRTKYFFYIVFGILFYIFYISASDIYPTLPPLMGILFLMFHKNYDNEMFYVPAIILICLFFYEFDKSLIIGIIPCVFFIVHLFIAQQLESLLLVNVIFILVYVLSLYIFYFAGMLLCNVLFKTQILEFSTLYFYYFAMDSILALIYYYITKD